jgi:hypothetical protein
MIIRSTISSDCKGRMYYIHKSMGKEYKEYLPKYRTRLSEYDSEELIDSLRKDNSVKDIYLYKIKYSDGRISLLANPNYPVGKFFCEDDDKAS